MTNLAPAEKSVPQPIPIPRMAFKIEEAAQALGVNYHSVYRLIQRGKLKASNALRHKLISVAEINRFLAEEAN